MSRVEQVLVWIIAAVLVPYLALRAAWAASDCTLALLWDGKVGIDDAVLCEVRVTVRPGVL